MTVRLAALSYDAHDPAALAAFWAGLLRREAVVDGDAVVLEPGAEPTFPLRFVPAAEAKTGQNRQHFDLTSTSWEDQRARVARALELGGRHVDVGQLPEEQHVVLADPEGNEFCVIPPGNGFLAGCGLVGALACDGSYAVGRFWSEALGWPLVWDQDEETAIQAPSGGTKISWGGPPPMPRASSRDRLRFDLAPSPGSDRQTEVDRLVALGATEVGADAVAAVLLDPDGNEFRVV